MATATDTGARVDPRLTPNRRLFAQQVSRGTGLNELVVQSWVLAEGGPDGNPLNIGPGKNYGSPLDAAAAVVRLLHTNAAYAPILRSATNTPQAQIDAIAASPWNGGYHASAQTHTDYRNLIRGVYQALGGRASSTTSGGGLGGVTGAVGDAAGAVGDAVGGVFSGPEKWIKDAEGWAANAAVTGLAYLLLTVAALLLFALGISRALGVPLPLPGPRAARMAEEVPF